VKRRNKFLPLADIRTPPIKSTAMATGLTIEGHLFAEVIILVSIPPFPPHVFIAVVS
jgi:hypothetical protein